MSKATLTISSKNYGAWALRGWLMARLARLDFDEKTISPDDPAMKAEILLLSPSFRVPALEHEGIQIWDTLAIGEYLHEIKPKAGLLPTQRKARAHCRSICGEMHSGFAAMRSSLPMNVKGHFPNYKIWSKAQNDIQRILDIWEECLSTYGGPFLFGAKPCMADAMFAPVVTRFRTYDVQMEDWATAYCTRIWTLPDMQAWVTAAQAEEEEVDELDAEF